MKKTVVSTLISLIALLSIMSVCLAAKPINYTVSDLTVLGIPYDANRRDIIAALGKPDSEGVIKISENSEYYVTYGGVRFEFGSKSMTSRISVIIIKNRDALTVRGIGVGDSQEKVISKYGRSYTVNNNSHDKEIRYVWGRYGTDDAHGFSFHCVNGTVSRIIIWP